MIRSITVLSALLLIISCYPKVSHTFEAEEIEEVMTEYRNSWLEGDSLTVLSKISDDIILFMSNKEDHPIVGKSEVGEFWFPVTDLSYPILKYEVSESEIGGGGNHAYYQGLSNMTWCTLENGIGRDTITSISEFTTLLKRDGEQWKISRIMSVSKDDNYTR